MLPTVEFCGLTVTRLIIGANPFGGYSHQNPERDEEMRSYYAVPRIIETWRRAEAAGINTMITNNETPHVLQAVREYLERRRPARLDRPGQPASQTRLASHRRGGRDGLQGALHSRRAGGQGVLGSR